MEKLWKPIVELMWIGQWDNGRKHAGFLNSRRSDRVDRELTLTMIDRTRFLCASMMSVAINTFLTDTFARNPSQTPTRTIPMVCTSTRIQKFELTIVLAYFIEALESWWSWPLAVATTTRPFFWILITTTANPTSLYICFLQNEWRLIAPWSSVRRYQNLSVPIDSQWRGLKRWLRGIWTWNKVALGGSMQSRRSRFTIMRCEVVITGSMRSKVWWVILHS